MAILRSRLWTVILRFKQKKTEAKAYENTEVRHSSNTVGKEGHTTIAYAAPITTALKLRVHDLVGDVRTACESMTAHDNATKKVVIKTSSP